MKLISISEVAQKLGVSDKTARKLKDELPGAVRILGRTKYREDAILDFITNGGCRTADSISGQMAYPRA